MPDRSIFHLTCLFDKLHQPSIGPMATSRMPAVHGGKPINLLLLRNKHFDLLNIQSFSFVCLIVSYT
ncbi:hypothetical protein JCM6292_1379 [Bacteroides pyogenes JCM 6292]|uniref:Uncharacterized protein n=2 Tax=Bacteroides pyogenes TaxID=310300 RepID=W4PI23_9BACE|nr:hypothetical protein JCM6292_1379 [Bacteroides pyogenes JCM 6292]GAE19360.1 hypothetical protein JCM6294_2403 [Bacteroides pyogenes DSM 20611 = JCM 6294]